MFMMKRPGKERRRFSWCVCVCVSGYWPRPNQVYVGTLEGMAPAWTIMRAGGHEEAKRGDILAARGTTRQSGPGSGGEDVHIRLECGRAHGEPPPAPPAAPPTMRSFYMTKSGTTLHAYVVGLRGVHCIQGGTSTPGTRTHAWRASRCCSGHSFGRSRRA